MSAAAGVQGMVPYAARVVERLDETRDIFTLRLALCDEGAHAGYDFAPGQFNMLYLHGVGEMVPGVEEALEGRALHDSLDDRPHAVRMLEEV